MKKFIVNVIVAILAASGLTACGGTTVGGQACKNTAGSPEVACFHDMNISDMQEKAAKVGNEISILLYIPSPMQETAIDMVSSTHPLAGAQELRIAPAGWIVRGTAPVGTEKDVVLNAFNMIRSP